MQSAVGMIIAWNESEVKKLAENERQEQLTKLHNENLRKISEAASRIEKEKDPVLVAYLAGRLDGALDAKWIRGRSA